MIYMYSFGIHVTSFSNISYYTQPKTTRGKDREPTLYNMVMNPYLLLFNRGLKHQPFCLLLFCRIYWELKQSISKLLSICGYMLLLNPICQSIRLFRSIVSLTSSIAHYKVPFIFVPFQVSVLARQKGSISIKPSCSTSRQRPEKTQYRGASRGSTSYWKQFSRSKIQRTSQRKFLITASTQFQ